MPKNRAPGAADAPAMPAPRKAIGVDPAAAHVAPSPADPPEVAADTLSPRARRAAAAKQREPAKKKDAKARKPGNLGAAGFERRKKGPDLAADLRAFVTARPAGWGHEDWLAFLDHLRERGHDTSDPDAIGLLLERERLAAMLERVQGMGPRRIQSVVDRYDTAWSAHQADIDEIAALPLMTRVLAEKVRQVLQ